MSVILDSRAGDGLICIESFSASPEGEGFSWETSRTFRVGERIRYVDFFQGQNLKDNPACWMVRFDAADNRRYAATQTYFVTEECWRGLKTFFARRLLREPGRRNGPRLSTQNP